MYIYFCIANHLATKNRTIRCYMSKNRYTNISAILGHKQGVRLSKELIVMCALKYEYTQYINIEISSTVTTRCIPRK